jgi:hypothetical protein
VEGRGGKSIQNYFVLSGFLQRRFSHKIQALCVVAHSFLSVFPAGKRHAEGNADVDIGVDPWRYIIAPVFILPKTYAPVGRHSHPAYLFLRKSEGVLS